MLEKGTCQIVNSLSMFQVRLKTAAPRNSNIKVAPVYHKIFKESLR